MKKERGEEKLRIRNTRKVYLPFYMMVFVLIIFITYIKSSGMPLNNTALVLALAFSIAVLIATEIHRLGNAYEIEENSIVHKHGYFSIISKRIEFGAISDVDVKQNLWQRMFLFGDVQIFKFSEKSIIKNIDKPFYFVSFLEKKMRNRQGRVKR